MKTTRCFHGSILFFSLAAVLLSFTRGAHAQGYEKVFDFGVARAEELANTANAGGHPSTELVQGSDGHFYGTTENYGASNFGTVFKVTAAGALTTLVEFTGNGASNKGSYPDARLVQGSDGHFYGTTRSGGASDHGTVFKMTATGALTTLVEFTGNGASNKGTGPAGLVQGSDGHFYGTTRSGGVSGNGTVFKMTATGELTTLVEFTGNGASNKGSQPYASLVQGSDGHFYGTTSNGGASDNGTVFKVTAAGALTTLVEFTGNGASNKGSYPDARLVQGSDGHFYGTTRSGGVSGNGTVFKMTATGELTTLVEFTGNGASNKGRSPSAGLVQGSDGHFYGTTRGGGASGFGTVFKMTPAGVLTTLVEFIGDFASNEEGILPTAGLVQGSDGHFYGTTQGGGTGGARFGTVFKVTAAGVLTTLVEFTGNGASNKGSQPYASLVQGSDGHFYGTTSNGGASDNGTVFKVTAAGALTTLVEFTGNGASNKGSYPDARLVQGSDGHFYGTTRSGGVSGFGTVFKMTATGLLTTLVGFTNNLGPNMGGSPDAGLVQGSDGHFYGTTFQGGTSGNGTVFKVTAAGELTTLVEFTGNGPSNKGSAPVAGLVQGSDGHFYGTTRFGGNFLGTVFKMTAAGELTTLVEFTGDGASNKGGVPSAGLVQGSDGHFYGTTRYFGASDNGTVFKVTAAGELTTLVEFTGNGATNKGSHPVSELVQGSDGHFYGTTNEGGANNLGTVFKMTATGELTTLVEFTDPSNGYPAGGLLRATDGNLYGTATGPDGSVFRLITPGTPSFFSTSARAQGSTEAVLEARVNARGAITAVTLEYGTDGTTFPNMVPVAVGLAGYQTKLVGATVSGLAPGTTYYYRFTATSSAGTTVSAVQSFSTLAEPLVVTTTATALQQTSATFNGTVNARNFASTVFFEWGTDGNSFPNTVPAMPGTVTGNSAVPVSVAVAGLTKGTQYFYRVRATNAAGTVTSGTQSFTTLTEPVATVGGTFALTTTSARVSGTVRARNSDAQVFFDYGTDGVTFPNSVGASPGLVTGDAETAVEADITNLAQGVTYYYRVRAVSAGGTGLSGSAPLQVAVLSGFLQMAPPSVPFEDRAGFLFVNLLPSGIGAGWRFVGEQAWRPPGVPVGGLTTGDREIEFRPAAGFDQPLRETVSVISGGAATFIEREYFEIGAPGGTGGMIVLLRPESLTLPALPVEERAQWRLVGEDENAWRESGAMLDGLRPGAYLVEAKPLIGRTTPPPLQVTVSEAQTSTAATTYFLAEPATGTPPALLPFETVSGSATLPYQWVGQLRSDAGAGSGFVVRPRVVATAAHVVFDDATLSAATGQQWLFQRDRASHEVTPLIPRGAYLFTGYSAQRAAENTPGTSSPLSQTLDAAAVYFLEDAGRGGFAGYLASDATPNEWLAASALKTLVGYPTSGISAGSQGRMHATPPQNAAFAHSFGRAYTTADIRGGGGMSGGPLCVQFENGSYYPAAIFLGGSGQTVVRVIDSDLIEMFSRAEVSANGGANNNDGGISHTSTPLTGAGAAGASLRVNLTGAAGQWRIGTGGSLKSSGLTLNSLTPGARTLNFTAVAGFITPPAYPVTLSSGVLTTVTVPYNGITAQPPDRVVDEGESATFTIGVSGVPTNWQWQRNGVNIPGATGTSHIESNVTAASTGSYRVIVTWENGAQTSQAATLKLAQAITFAAIADTPLGAPPLLLGATASSGLPITFTLVSGPASLSGNALTLTGYGTVSVRASQGGSGAYAAAANITHTFAIIAATPATWSAQYFTPAEIADENIGALLADGDRDSISNLLEFAFNLDPRDGALVRMTPFTGTAGLPDVRRNIAGNLVIEFVRRKAAIAPGITTVAEFASTPAGPWTPATANEITDPINATFERVKVTDPAPAPNRFARVRVTVE